VVAEEADAVAEEVAVADADGAEDVKDTVEADEGSVDEDTLLGIIPHPCAIATRPAEYFGLSPFRQFAQVVIVVAPSGVNALQEHDIDPLHARYAKYAVKEEEH
jgi:hypothetical protein